MPAFSPVGHLLPTGYFFGVIMKTEHVDYFVYEKKVHGSVPGVVADAFALMEGEADRLLKEYDRKLKAGFIRGASQSAELEQIETLEKTVVSMIFGSIRRKFIDIDKQARRMYCAAEYRDGCGKKSCIVMNRTAGPFRAGVSAYIWLREEDGRCVGTLEWCRDDSRDDRIVRTVIDASDFNEAYDLIQAQEGELANEMDQLVAREWKAMSEACIECTNGVGAES